VVARTSGDPEALSASLARLIRETDARVPIGQVRTMEQVLVASLDLQRFIMLLLGTFSGLAVLLAGVGVYGLISYIVSQRTHEVGVRIALGAGVGDVLALIIRRGMLLAAIGTALGLVGALGLTRLLSGLLFGVRATDPSTFILVTLLLGTVALAACYIPARRATRVEPMAALRTE